MNEEANLEEAVLTWVNSFPQHDFVHSFLDLNDGSALLHILNEVDSTIWRLHADPNGADHTDPNFKLANLQAIYEGMQQFYGTHMGIDLSDDFIDLHACSQLGFALDGKLHIDLTVPLKTRSLVFIDEFNHVCLVTKY